MQAMPDHVEPTADPVNPRRRTMLIVSMLAVSWLGMQWVHEAGHVVAAMATRARVERVVLHPLGISRTDLQEVAWPLVTTWAGPIVGILFPVIAWIAVSLLSLPTSYLFRFFAGFCCVANGVYLGLGSLDGVGDAGELLKHGAPAWHLWAFGVIATAIGLLLWHRQGPAFGFGPRPKTVSTRHAFVLVVIAVSLATMGALHG